MISDVSVDILHMDSPLSTITTPSQAADSPSVTNDKIFFGPLQSPEKKYALPPGSRPLRTPVRRSSRLSSAMVPLPLFSESSREPDTREGTPEEDALMDEPSIILASRVLSACSNPSPPPSPPLLAQQYVLEADDVRHLDVLRLEDTEEVVCGDPSGPLISLEDLPEPIPASSHLVLPPSASSVTLDQANDRADVSQPDLITFDSVPSTVEGDQVATPTTHKPKSTPTQPAPVSVDDLLSMSPLAPLSSEVAPSQADCSILVSDIEPTPTPDEEIEVAHALLIEADGCTPPTLLAEVPLSTEPTDTPLAEVPMSAEVVAQPIDSPANVPTDNDQTPPLRRSSRPRRSRSSLPHTIIDTSPQSTPHAAIAADEPTEDLQQTVQRKRKLRPPLDAEDTGESRVTDAPTTPRRLPQMERTQRELGSLSPMSAAVLGQLLPRSGSNSASGSATPQPPSLADGDAPAAVIAPAPKTPPPTSFVFPRIGPSEASADGLRPKSPLRPFSPSKFGEGSRTPARRVPISQAIADGTFSAQKLPAAFGVASRVPNQPGSPVFRKLALDDPARSPAKRVPMSEARPVAPPSPGKTSDKGKGKDVYRPQSPVRSSSVPPRERQRSASVEPQPPLGRRVRGTSAEPASQPPSLGRRPLFQKPASSDGVTTGLKPRTVLPYPIAQQQRIPPSIPEADETGSSIARPIASPVKTGSSLRQPSAGAGSKIPRIGAKPYARPKMADAAPSKLPTPAKSRIVTRAKPLRIVNVGSSSGSSSSDEGHGSNSATSKPPTLKPRRVVTAQSSNSSASSADATTHGLKRKREAEATSTKPPAQPIIVMRKVVPGMFNKGKEAAPSLLSQPVAPTALASPAKPMRARSAVGWKRPQPEGQVAVQHPPRAEEVFPEELPVFVSAPSGADPQRSTVKEAREPTPPPPAPVPILPVPAEEAAISLPAAAPVPVPIPEPSSEAQVPTHAQRRSTRSKRTTTPSTDVFGSVIPTATVRPLQRRRGLLPSETAGPFAGMSALALKTLTSANTLKNQQQVATIQTEVVRKEGNRPDSPTTRVRSALEKQKEERIQQRHERAERRARRSAGSDIEPVAAESAGEEAGMSSDSGEGNRMSVDRDTEEMSGRHRRGPGDEEDYETPPRPERPAKRGRFEDDEKAKVEEGQMVVGQEKRVKWDRGLHTMVFLEDTPPKPRWDLHAVPSQKSCLTPAAKALRLDTLGNVLNAEVPLGGLVKENVVVKKFVFDDDEAQAAAQAAAAAPAPAPVKSTRSKSRKAKS